MKLRRRAKVCAALLAVFLAQVTTFLLFARSRVEVAVIRNYASEGGFEGRRFVYVHEITSKLSEAEKARVTRELRRHVPAVYTAPEDLPEICRMPFSQEAMARIRRAYQEAKSQGSLPPADLESSRRLIERGYEVDWSLGGGIALSWRVDGYGPFWMEATLYRSDSRTSVSIRADVCVWVLWRWFKIHSGIPEVS